MKISGISNEAKVGLLVAVALLILAFLTIKVSDLSLSPGGTYTVYATMENAEGVTPKTPVQVAGIPVGVVSNIELLDSRQARIAIRLKKGLILSQDAELQVRNRGVLGDTFIEILPGQLKGMPLLPGQSITRARPRADYQDLYGEVEETTKNLKEITEALKVYTVSDKSHTAQILQNMEVLTQNLATFSVNNMGNMNAIVVNLRKLSDDLRHLSGNSSGEIELAINRIEKLTEKIEKGEGTIGKLFNDPTTVDKANEVLGNISDLTGSYAGMQTEIGYHMEYLGGEGSFKNYVSFKLQPKPDKFFLFEVVHDPHPPPSTSDQITTVSSGGITSVIATQTENFDKIRFSAELGKKFGDFTLRGGLIESTGGAGIDYSKGPFTVQFSAFDFSAPRPNLKLLTTMNITPSIYLLTGVEDFISTEHDLNWIAGAGIRLTDEDLKSLIGGAAGVFTAR